MAKRKKKLKKSTAKGNVFYGYKDRRYRIKEEDILDYYEKSDEPLNVKKLTKNTNVSKATFHRHHARSCMIQRDYENYILNEFSKYMKKFCDYPLKETYRRLLCFIVINRRIFSVFPKKRGEVVFRTMITKIKPKILTKAHLGKLSFKVYSGEIVAILKDWVTHGSSQKELDTVLNNIIYLTTVATIRLSGLKERGK